MRDALLNFSTELKRIGRGIKNLRFFKFSHLKKITGIFSLRERLALVFFFIVLLANLALIGGKLYVNATKVVPSNGGTYTEGIVGAPRYVNPLFAQNQAEKDLVRLVFAGLYKYDNQGRIIPDLAQSEPQISANQKEYIVTLRPDLKWHDGQKITADDVTFTIQTIQDPQYKSPLQPLWKNITVEKIDDSSVKFTSTDVSSPFITNLTLGILPKHIWANVEPSNFINSKFNLEPVGSGPYFIKEINKLTNGELKSMILESYSNYWSGKPRIDHIVISFYATQDDLILAFRSKDIDGIGYVPFDIKPPIDEKSRSIQIVKTPLYQYQTVFFNLTRTSKILGDRTVRQALAQATDRSDIIRNVYSNSAKAAYGPILPGQIGYDSTIEQKNPLDLNAANVSLDIAGWVMDPNTNIRTKGGDQLKFILTTNDFVLNAKTAEALKDQWAKIGVKVDINIVPTADFSKTVIQPRAFDALLFGENTGFDPDPFVFWHSSQAQTPGFNIAQYKNNTSDSLISEARNTLDANIRTEKYKEFQNIMSIDLPAIFLVQNEFVYTFRDTIPGMKLRYLATPEDRFYDVPNWYLDTKRVFK